MDQWEYGELHCLSLRVGPDNNNLTMVERHYVVFEGGSELLPSASRLAVMNRLGVEGWMIGGFDWSNLVPDQTLGPVKADPAYASQQVVGLAQSWAYMRRPVRS